MWPMLISAAASVAGQAAGNNSPAAAAPAGDASAQNTFNQTFGGFGDFTVNYGAGSTVTPSHTSTQSPTQTASPVNNAGSGGGSAAAAVPDLMPVAIAAVAVVFLGVVIFALKR